MVQTQRSHAFTRTWTAVWVLGLALQLGLGFGSDTTLHAPHLIFWIVVIAASACLVDVLLRLRAPARAQLSSRALDDVGRHLPRELADGPPCCRDALPV